MTGPTSATTSPTARPRSLWAVASLLCSALICPPLCVIGPVLGVAALLEMRWRPRRGRGLAVAGIAVGLVFTAGWLSIGSWMHVRNFRPMRDGPRVALECGDAGDVAGFRREFRKPADDDETRAFIAELRGRYGAFRGSRQDLAAMEANPPTDLSRPRLFYELEFERSTVSAEARFVRFDRNSAVFRFAWLRILDPDLGPLAYPLSEASSLDPPPTPETSDRNAGP